jgi:predicted small lipoprotein YifL
MKLLSYLLALLTVLSLSSCGRWVPGYIVTEEGQVLSNNDENMRSTTIDTMHKQLNAQLKPDWCTEITIAELPIYERDDRVNADGWRWQKATVSVDLIGRSSDIKPLLSAEQLSEAISDFMAQKVILPKKNLRVSVNTVIDKNRFISATTPKPKAVENSPDKTAPATDTTTRAATSAAQSYVVQAGDTYANLSSAFYGDNAHWRTIADANEHKTLTPGMSIIIPPLKPAPLPAP